MQVLTLATSATLPQARVLAASLRHHQPDWLHELVLVGLEAQTSVAGESLRLRPAAEMLDLDVDRLLARYDEDQLCELLLPRLLQTYSKLNAGPVLHMPPTAWVLSDLGPVAAALQTRSVLLVPRMTADVPNDGLGPSREEMEMAGRISETIVGVDGTHGADGFLTWWAGYVEETLGSLDGVRHGARPEDRPWLGHLLELAPARFSTAVLEDPGCNLSMWNLHLHSLQATADGVLVDGRWPLRFLDLPGFDPDHPHCLSVTASRVRISRSPALRELCARYATELQQAGWQALNYRSDLGRRLANGLVYDDALHVLHARAIALGQRFEDLFGEDGSHAFTAWLEGPAPEGGAYGINRYVFYRVARERPDVMWAYPDLNGANGAEYVAWCWAFGRAEMAIPERFLPPPPGHARARAAEVLDAPAPGGSSFTPAPSEDGAVSRDTRGTESPVPRAAGGQNGAPRAPVAGGSAPAVRITGYLSHSLGLGAAARGYAQALAATGVPTSTVSVPLHHLELPAELTAEYGRHGFEDVVHDGRHGFEIVAVNADELPDLVDRLGDDYFQGPRIGIWGWETNVIPARWGRAFALLDEIWVYSRFMAENIGVVSPVPVIALPPPVQPPAQPAAPLRLGAPDDGFLFLFAFDYLSTIQRKNPVGLIEAFTRAFAPGEGPHLLIKTINAPLRPLAEEEVLWAAHGRPDVHIVDRSLSAAERDGLMAACDCYVSLHRSEGFGLTLAEAMAIGKPVIATGYSGNVDFMNVENSYLVDYDVGRVGPGCEIYPADGEWAEPNLEHAAHLIRGVCEGPHEAARIGTRAREDIIRTLSPDAAGAAMLRRLEELAARRLQEGPTADSSAASS